MASRRDLKKKIHDLSGMLLTYLAVNDVNAPESNKEQATAILIEIAEMRREFLSRISHTEPGNVKGFYKKLREDIKAQSHTLMDKIFELYK